MKFLRNMERKFGKYAVRNLSTILIAICAIGCVMYYAAPGLLIGYFPFNPEYVFRHGQWWRIFTWVFVPFEQPGIFTVIMLFFYYSVARTMERTWGDFYFDVFTFSGMILTIVSACLIYAAASAMNDPYAAYQIQSSCTIYYVLLSILLAFALTYPDTEVLLFFLIPIKIRYLGWLYVIFLIYDFITASSWPRRIIMLVSLLNVIIYFLMTRNYRRPSRRRARAHSSGPVRFRKRKDGKTGSGTVKRPSFGQSVSPEENGQQARGGRSQDPKSPSGEISSSGSKVLPIRRKGNPGGARHCCAICGRTELTNPELEFRYCSKCEGNVEYCQDHLFNHIHVKNGSRPMLASQAQTESQEKEGNHEPGD